jgi:hypothetical protein
LRTEIVRFSSAEFKHRLIAEVDGCLQRVGGLFE